MPGRPRLPALGFKHFGSAEALQQANEVRLERWTVNSSTLAREVTLR